jgi:hypothetical protein
MGHLYKVRDDSIQVLADTLQAHTQLSSPVAPIRFSRTYVIARCRLLHVRLYINMIIYEELEGLRI